MLSLNSPSDKDVEVTLGPVLGSWEPLPIADVSMRATLPEVGQNRFTGSLLGCLPFILGTVAAFAVGVQAESVPAGIATAIVLLCIMCFGFVKLCKQSHELTRAGVFTYGIRYGRSLIRFRDLKLITFGVPTPKTWSQQHLPGLIKLKRSLEKQSSRDLREKQELSRELALSLWLHDDTHVVWLSFGAMYGSLS